MSDPKEGRATRPWLPAAVAFGALVSLLRVNPSEEAWVVYGVRTVEVAPALWVGNLTVLLGAGLCAGLVWAAPTKPGSSQLAWLIALIGASYSVSIISGVPGSDPVERLPLAVSLGLLVFALSNWMRFTLRYPAPVEVSSLREDRRLPGLKERYRSDRLLGCLRAWDHGRVARARARMGSGAARRALGAELARRWRRVRTGARGGLRSRSAETLLGGSTQVVALAALVSLSTAVHPILGVLVLGWLFATGYLTANLALATGRSRVEGADLAKVLWLENAISVGLVAVLVVGSIALSWLLSDLIGGESGLFDPVIPHALPFVVVTAFLSFLVCLGIAVFWYGALDPERVLRGSLLYGALTATLFFTFQLLEEVVGRLFAGRGTLPDSVDSIAAGAIVAVLAAPFHAALAMRVDKRVEDRLSR